MRDLFAAEYLKDFNATQAAIRAGYSRKTAASQGQRLLKSAAVGNAIARAQAKLLKKTEVSVDNVVRELATIAFLDPGQLVDEKGALLPPNQMPEEAGRGLTRLGVRDLFDSKRGNKTHIGRRCKLSFPDKMAALEVLGKYLHMFPQTSEVPGQEGKPPTPAERRGLPLEAAAHISELSTSEILTPWKPPPPELVGKPPSRAGMKGRGSFMRDRFSVEYLKDFNATQAAIRAGYSRKTAAPQGQRLLKCPAVGKAIAEARARLLKKAEISVERWRKELAAIGFVNFGNFLDKHGAPLPINEMPEENRRALARVEFDELFESDRGEKTRIAVYLVSCSDKLAALDMLWEDWKML